MICLYHRAIKLHVMCLLVSLFMLSGCVSIDEIELEPVLKQNNLARNSFVLTSRLDNVDAYSTPVPSEEEVYFGPSERTEANFQFVQHRGSVLQELSGLPEFAPSFFDSPIDNILYFSSWAHLQENLTTLSPDERFEAVLLNMSDKESTLILNVPEANSGVVPLIEAWHEFPLVNLDQLSLDAEKWPWYRLPLNRNVDGTQIGEVNQLLIERSFEIANQLECPSVDNIELLEDCVVDELPAGAAKLDWESISGRVLISHASGEATEYTLVIFGEYGLDLLSCTNVRLVQPTLIGATSLLVANCGSSIDIMTEFLPNTKWCSFGLCITPSGCQACRSPSSPYRCVLGRYCISPLR